MKIPDSLRCVFTASIVETEDSVLIEVPEREVTEGTLSPGETYQVALAATNGGDESQTYDHPSPPVEEGDQHTVEIEDEGEQGDGIARVDGGYVLIVPDVDVGARVTVEIADVAETVAFTEVVEEHPYYE